MTPQSLTWFWFVPASLATGLSLGLSSSATAQLIPDNSLGAENSIVTEDVQIRGANGDRIDGGAIRGGNLFHSFQDFNVGNNERVYFANPNNIDRILTRVTGNNISDILGTLGVDGNADLFLLNPNGIFFGPNARLDLRGSFVATTANSFTFPDNVDFSAVDPQAPPLLTVNVPLGVQYGANPPGAITGQNSNLAVGADQSLLLLGGEITLNTTRVEVTDSAGGNIALVGIGGAGTVELIPNGNQLQVTVPDAIPRADITLNNGTRISAIGPEGGAIDVEAQNLNISNFSSISTGISPGDGTPDGQARNVSVNAVQEIILDGGFILNTVEQNGVGNAGNVVVTSETLTLTNGAQISSITLGTGDSGNLLINTQDSVVLEGTDIFSQPSAILTNVGNNATGNGGDINLTTDTLTLRDGAFVTANVTSDGNAGNITINAQESMLVSGESPLLVASVITSSALRGATGDAGDITISTRNLTLQEGGQINASVDGTGNAGNIQVDVRNETRMEGTNSQGFPSAIVSAIVLEAIGESGNITLDTGDLTLLNGGQINTTTGGAGSAGSIGVTVRNDLVADGGNDTQDILSGIFSFAVPNAVGDGGNINVTANNLSLRNGAFISSDTFGSGNAGTITIDVPGSLVAQGESRLINGDEIRFGNVSGIFSRVGPGAIGDAQGITVTAGTLSLLDGAQISSATYGDGNAGDINVTVQGELLAQGDSGLGESSGINSGIFFGLNVDDAEDIIRDANALRDIFLQIRAGDTEDLNIVGASGNAGNLTIATGELSLLDGGQINSSTLSNGNAGLISIEAQESILLRGGSSSILSLVEDTATGSSAGIRIRTPQLTIRDGAEINTSTAGSGNAGNVRLRVDDQLRLNQGTISTETSADGDGGDILVIGDRISLLNSSITSTATDTASADNQGGDITVEANRLNLSGEESGILAETQGEAAAGTVTIRTRNNGDRLVISFADNARISAATSGQADAGSLLLEIPDVLVLQGQGRLSAETTSDGAAGDIDLDLQRLVVRDGAQISVNSELEAIAGDITINAQRVQLENGGGLTAETEEGSGGDISLQISDLLTLETDSVISASTVDGTGGRLSLRADAEGNPIPQVLLSNGSRLETEATGAGNAGAIRLNVLNLDLNNNSRISASAISGNSGDIRLPDLVTLNLDASSISASTESGEAGGIFIQATDAINLTGEGGFSVEGDRGTAGNIRVRTPQLQLDEGAVISATTTTGRGGNISLLELDTLVLDNGAGIRASTDAGIAGDIVVRATDFVNLSGGSGIFVEGDRGTAGNIQVRTSQLQLNEGAVISATTTTGREGNISLLELDTLVLDNGAEIRASTQTGDAGDIQIESQDRITLDNNAQISVAATQGGQAGGLEITTTRLSLDNNSDATVSSTLNGQSGNLTIRTETLSLTNRSGLRATAEDGIGGRLTLSADSDNNPMQQAVLSSGSQITTEATGSGDAGAIRLNVLDLNLADNSNISASTISGRSGNIRLPDLVTLNLDTSSIVASTQSGDAGNIFVRATDSINFTGEGGLSVEGNQRTAGNIRVRTPQLQINEDASISATTTTGSGGDISLVNLDTLALDTGAIAASTESGEAGSIRIESQDRITLDNNARISVAATQGGQAGGLEITTTQLSLDNNAEATVSSTRRGRSGDLSVEATTVSLNNEARIAAETAAGEGGNITIQVTDALQLNDGSEISALTQDGEAGTIIINGGTRTGDRPLFIPSRSLVVNDAIPVQQVALDNSQISTEATRDGNAGEIDITTRRLSLTNDSNILASTVTGDGGQVSLQGMRSLNVQDSQVSASTQRGQAGQLTVDAENQIQIAGNGGLLVQGNAGQAGDLQVTTQRLNLENNATISAETTSGTGGNITLRGLDRLTVNDGQIAASTRSGEAGSVQINARDSVQLEGNETRVAVEATENGIAGNLSVTTDQLTVNDGAEISVSSPEGQAGNLTVTTQQAQLFDGEITAVTGQSGEAGGANIVVNAPNLLLLRNGSLISAEALGDADGGNVTIDNRNSYILAISTENSDIVANAFQGDGGRINIQTQGLFGIQFRENLTPLSDINASSEFGAAGIVAIEGPIVDPTRGLTELPADLVDASRLVGRQCPGRGSQVTAAQLGEFYLVGRGGIPEVPDPDRPRNVDTIIADWVTLDGESEPAAEPQSMQPDVPQRLVEASHWIINEAGQVVLVADASHSTPLPLFVPLCGQE